MFQSFSEIRELFDHFIGIKVLIVGDVMIDTYLRGHVERISPEAPVPVVALERKEDMLGGAANVALNVKSLGAIPILCSVVGEDPQGLIFNDLLKKEDISTEGIIRVPDRVSTTKYRIVGNKMQMLRVDHETLEEITPDQEKLLLTRIKELILEFHPEVIILQDYNKGVLTPAVISGIQGMAGNSGIPIAVDPKKNNFNEYKGAKLFKPNLKEIREGLKTFTGDATNDALSHACEILMKNQGHEMIMITLSEAGMYIQGNNTATRIKAHLRSIADVSGAGDTVISLAALSIAAGISPIKMASLANLAGGQVCEELGVVPVNKEKLLSEAGQWLVEQNQEQSG